MSPIWAVLIAFIVMSSFAGFHANGQVLEYESILIITKTGLSLSKESIQKGNIDAASEYLTIANNYFGKNIQNLRNNMPELANEIHLGLLDIRANLKKSSVSENLTQIENLILTIEKIKPENNHRQVANSILSFADELYQTSFDENNEYNYKMSSLLISESRLAFEKANLDQRLEDELTSFYDELESLITEKASFVTVGKLVTSIQRDLIGTNNITYQEQEFYSNIRELYNQLFVSIEQNDYSKAEELAIEAYLENFEYLEPNIERANPELLHTLEIQMREDLRDMIKSKEDPDSIKQFVSFIILPQLETAEALTMELQPVTITGEDSMEEIEMGKASEEEKSGVRNEIDTIRNKLEETLAHYQNKDYDSAFASARSAYLDSYEFVEIPLRSIDADFTLEVEYQFATLRNQIKDQRPYDEVQKSVVDIRRNLDESERIVTGTGQLAPTIAFSSSFAVIFREGLESVLILGAIVTYLEASRNTKYKKYVYYGIVLAIGATAITWVLASYIIDISGANRELVEAIAALSATGVLFYVSFWILSKIEHKKWMEFVKAKVWQASTTGGVMVFVMLSFFTVYREGFETVLFYQAMFSFAKYMELYVGLGFILGIASLLGLYFVMRKLGKRLPLRILFGLTMGIGAYLSIAFLGNAVRELQILDIVPYTGMIGTIPRLDINLAMMTGIYPTLETLIAQIVLLGVYLSASSYVLIVRPRKERKLESMRKSRQIVDEH